ncbi:unnamed protein product [Microthlaspi erraticum]|uniref:Uncharacterized protein n=1 Tax=Microthlaspi erraticum TaxID=1685480 RepID=A0A6D2JXK1_9BRAS|nr:unnamed protein product [Microthlaspi erraticum]
MVRLKNVGTDTFNKNTKPPVTRKRKLTASNNENVDPNSEPVKNQNENKGSAAKLTAKANIQPKRSRKKTKDVNTEPNAATRISDKCNNNTKPPVTRKRKLTSSNNPNSEPVKNQSENKGDAAKVTAKANIQPKRSRKKTKGVNNEPNAATRMSGACIPLKYIFRKLIDDVEGISKRTTIPTKEKPKRKNGKPVGPTLSTQDDEGDYEHIFQCSSPDSTDTEDGDNDKYQPSPSHLQQTHISEQEPPSTVHIVPTLPESVITQETVQPSPTLKKRKRVSMAKKKETVPDKIVYNDEGDMTYSCVHCGAKFCKGKHASKPDKKNRLRKDIIDALTKMLDDVNPYVKNFRTARERFNTNPEDSFHMRIISDRVTDGRTYNVPTVSEVAAIIPGDFNLEMGTRRDIVLEKRSASCDG